MFKINLTYVNVTKTLDKIVAKHRSFRLNKFNLKVTDINTKISNVHWTPKLHINPTKASFTIATSK